MTSNDSLVTFSFWDYSGWIMSRLFTICAKGSAGGGSVTHDVLHYIMIPYCYTRDGNDCDVLKATIENISAFLELGKTCIYNDHLGAQLCHSWGFSSAGDIYILVIFAWMNLAVIFLYLYLFISRFTKYKK